MKTMPKFSQASFSKLSTCHIDLQVLFFEVIKNVDCTILEGHRGQEDQDKAYLEGRSKLKWPEGKHNHVPSLAVDVAPYPLPKWDNVNDFIYFAGYVMGIAQKLFDDGKITHKIRCGNDWNKNFRVSDERFIDAVHFEIVD